MADHIQQESVQIPIGDILLDGFMAMPTTGKGLVIFAHGSGSGRLSPRNQFVAQVLRAKGLVTLLFDLLTEEEDRVYENRFNINLIADRLTQATAWLLNNPENKELRVGYFGASTGAAAALQAAAYMPDPVKAIVSRGGRPDLAMPTLPQVKAPTLLIVGGNDDVVITLNQQAYDALQVEKKLLVIPGATHLFEETGALETVAEAAGEWFVKYLE
ncbi:MAG: putative phosphoribosyl transferase [bacterium ADurb.Bin400]|nr:MAG: putative phosphoribosyl transferase [bacterium ADurb.Bin400]